MPFDGAGGYMPPNQVQGQQPDISQMLLQSLFPSNRAGAVAGALAKTLLQSSQTKGGAAGDTSDAGAATAGADQLNALGGAVGGVPGKALSAAGTIGKLAGATM